MHYDFRYGPSAGKEPQIEAIVQDCIRLEAGDSATFFDFGDFGNIVLHVYKDEDFVRETGQYNFARVHAAVDGAWVNEPDDVNVSDGELAKELAKIWEDNDLPFL